MISQYDVEESTSLLSIISIVIAGVNFMWGMFIFPWGLFGFISGFVDIYLFFFALKIRAYYLVRDYKKAKELAHYGIFLGLLFGLVITGIFTYTIYRGLEEIIIRAHLVRGKPGIVYAPPQFPYRGHMGP